MRKPTDQRLDITFGTPAEILLLKKYKAKCDKLRYHYSKMAKQLFSFWIKNK